ncbi:MAG: hypothetical protein OEO82_02495 [Gammaproteobacteria bacterium]|nr:hypothetical protein [Gammaproteobacteria bacterium]
MTVQLNKRRNRTMDPAALLAPVLMVSGLLLGHLQFHAYPLLAPESLIALVAAAVIGASLGLIPALLGPSNTRALMLGLTLLIFIDFQFGSNAIVRNLLDNDHGLPQWAFFSIAFAFGFIVFLAFLSMREHIATIFVTGFGAFFLSTLLIPAPSMRFGAEGAATPVMASRTDSIVLHLILDGHIGIEGIPLDMTGGPETKAALLRFYEKWGFRVFGGAYSPYLMTLNSVANLMNSEVSPIDLVNVEAGHRYDRAYGVTENKYFRAAAQRNRNIRIYQSDYLDFCADTRAPIEYCFTYPTSSINALTGSSLAATTKARIILDSFLRRENISGKIYADFFDRSYYSSIAVPEVFSTMREDMIANPAGKLFFGHLMLPHDPYIWDRQCQLRPDAAQWISRRPDHTDLTTLGTPDYRQQAYAHYFDQVHCVVRQLDALLLAIDEAGHLQDATIIIHGDHGSRITLRDPIIAHRDAASRRDYIDSFSTLFAIRSPDLEPGYSSELQALPNLIATHAFGNPPPMAQHTVYLRNDAKLEGLDLMPVRMPDLGSPQQLTHSEAVKNSRSQLE